MVPDLSIPGQSMLRRAKALFGLQEGLSETAQAKMASITRRANDAAAIVMNGRFQLDQIDAEISDLNISIGIKHEQLDRLVQKPDSEVKILAALEADLVVLQAERKRFQSERSQRTAEAGALRQIGDNLSSYVRRHSGRITAFFGAIDPKLLTGETLANAVERRRSRISELSAELGSVKAAPLPSSEAKRRARDEIAQLAEAGKPDVRGICHRDQIGWPKRSVTGQVSMQDARAGAFAIIETIDSHATLAWLFQDQLVARVEAEIELVADDRTALTDEQREKRSGEIGAEILLIEREEETLITRIEELAGAAALTRRADADPRAVLGLASDMPAPVKD